MKRHAFVNNIPPPVPFETPAPVLEQDVPIPAHAFLTPNEIRAEALRRLKEHAKELR